MKRREFITLLGGAAAAWPLVARAQQGAKIPRIGIIDDAPMWQTFRQALRELGYIEGQNIAYEYRYSEGAPDRLATIVGELIRRPVDLIATFGTAPTHARASTRTATRPPRSRSPPSGGTTRSSPSFGKRRRAGVRPTPAAIRPARPTSCSW